MFSVEIGQAMHRNPLPRLLYACFTPALHRLYTCLTPALHLLYTAQKSPLTPAIRCSCFSAAVRRIRDPWSRLLYACFTPALRGHSAQRYALSARARASDSKRERASERATARESERERREGEKE